MSKLSGLTLEDGDLTGLVIGCAMRVHTTMGYGFQESIYQNALEIELAKTELEFIREYEIPIHYDGKVVGARRVDFLIANRIPVELKAVAVLEDVHLAQAKNYLEAYNLRVGLLLNFGSKSLEIKRLINSRAILSPSKN